jgi:hypothetical protein
MGVSTTSPSSQDMILVTTTINPIFVPIDLFPHPSLQCESQRTKEQHS